MSKLENQPDFKHIEIPEDKPPEKYTWQQRRAEIYQIIKRKGYPELNSIDLSKRYKNVSSRQIRYDLEIIRKYISKNHDPHKFVAIGKLIWEKGIQHHVANNQYREAGRLWNTWKNFLYEDGVREKTPDRQEIKLENDLDNAFSRAEQYLQKKEEEEEETVEEDEER